MENLLTSEQVEQFDDGEWFIEYRKSKQSGRIVKTQVVLSTVKLKTNHSIRLLFGIWADNVQNGFDILGYEKIS